MTNVKEISELNFNKEVLESDIPVVVDFWASWCGPCRMMAPVLENIASKSPQNLKVLKLNVDENPEISNNYGITGIPCLIVFKKGKEVDRIVGFRQEGELNTRLSNHVR